MSVENLLQQQLGVAAAVAVVLALLIMILRPDDRRAARNTLVAALLLVAADAGGALALRPGPAQAAAVLHDVTAVAMGCVLIRLATLLLFRVLLPALRITPPRIVGDISLAVAFAAWGLLWLRMSGVDLASIFATSAVMTGIVVFSMQETLGNLLGGLALQLDNSVRIGDWVRIDDVSGRVVEVRWRFTAVETRNRETVVVPNSYLMKNRFTVIGSRTDPDLRWRRWVWFDVNLDASPMRVCQVLERAVRNAEIRQVARDPAPSAVLMGFEGGAGRYALRYWLTEPGLDDPTDSLVRAHCHAGLVRHGMKLAVIREERTLIQEDEASRAAHRAEELGRRVRALRGVDLFRVLSEAELERLADHLVAAPFVAGATMTHQGDVAHWLYLIVAGEAEVWVQPPAGERSRVATLGAGQVFGEMGMMTGEPRRATVIARTDVDCYRLDKAGFEHVLTARPDLAAEMSQVLAARGAELQKVQAMGAGAAQSAGDAILARIRSFFGLEQSRPRR